MKYLAILLALALTGCTGYITGHEYELSDAEKLKECLDEVYSDDNLTDKLKGYIGL